MKLEISDELINEIWKRRERWQTYADAQARLYASSDDKAAKQAFEKYMALEGECREIHTLVCQYLHAIEAEIKEVNVNVSN